MTCDWKALHDHLYDLEKMVNRIQGSPGDESAVHSLLSVIFQLPKEGIL